jgi:hypothetical protein
MKKGCIFGSSFSCQEEVKKQKMKCLNYRTPNEMIFFEQFKRFPPIRKKIIFPEKIPRDTSLESGLINA